MTTDFGANRRLDAKHKAEQELLDAMSEQQELKLGDRVVLNSGGPAMTVTALRGEDGVAVAWQHNDSFETATGLFPAACLTKLPE